MGEIVDIETRIESKKQKRQLDEYRGKVGTIQKLVQCSSCHFRCAMCGLHLKEDALRNFQSPSFKFVFCEDCKKEFEDFLHIWKEGKSPDVFWHNKEWVKMWSKWLDYRRAMNGFINSAEFKLLLEELDLTS